MARRDPAKRIHAVLLNSEESPPRIILTLDSGPIESECKGLSHDEAEIYRLGLEAGLRHATHDALEKLQAGRLTLANAMDHPLRWADLFRDGVMEAVRMTVRGYWLDERGLLEPVLAALEP